MNQNELFHGEHLPPRIAYQHLFEYLPTVASSQHLGRPLTDFNALLRSFVYRCLRCLPTISDLAYSLRENPSLVEAVGLDPFAPVPSVERFSAWLRSTPNELLQQIRVALVSQLLHRGAIQGSIVALDGSAVPSAVRENNLKTSVTDRFNKNRPPKGDTEARLGAYRVYLGSGTRKIRYFWGYRNHIVVDFATELPLWEETRPANYHESRLAVPLLEACHNNLKLPIEVVCADSAYDAEKILVYIIDTLHAQPVIAPNSRYQPKSGFRVQGKDVLCPADLSMIHRGRMTPKRTGITYREYCCPLHYSKTMRQRFLLCPADHPKFISQKGCYHLVRETPSYRSRIAYGSAEFKNLYKKRTSAERVFSRLLSLAMQRPTVRGLQTTQNYCTIAHISVLLVALAAHDQGYTDKLSFVRSFVPTFMSEKSMRTERRLL